MVDCLTRYQNIPSSFLSSNCRDDTQKLLIPSSSPSTSLLLPPSSSSPSSTLLDDIIEHHGIDNEKNHQVKQMTMLRPVSPSIFSIPSNKNISSSGYVQCIIHRVRPSSNQKKSQTQTLDNSGSANNNNSLSSNNSNKVLAPTSGLFHSPTRFTFSFQEPTHHRNCSENDTSPLQCHERLAIIAEKQIHLPLFMRSLNSVNGGHDDKKVNKRRRGTFSVYYFFDATRFPSNYDFSRSKTGKKLNRKAGHYIGSMLRVSGDGVCYSLFNAQDERIATYEYDVPSLAQQWKDGQPPRKLKVMLFSSQNKKTKTYYLNTKQPFYEGGQYRLNFHGRVSTPSVKNFQITSSSSSSSTRTTINKSENKKKTLKTEKKRHSEVHFERDEDEELVAQFGKIANDSFHMDYKQPFTAFQAFGMALTQFDM